MERPIEFETYSNALAGNLVISGYESDFKKKQQNIEGAHRLLSLVLEE